MTTRHQQFLDSPEETVRGWIEDFVANSPQNRLVHVDGRPIFAKPLVGFADGDDPMFQDYKRIIGEFHMTPREVMQASAPGADVEHVSVICYVLPVNDETRASNCRETRHPSLEWAHTRNCGEPFNDAVRRHVVEKLREAGHAAVAPVVSDLFTVRRDSPVGIASTWSERHVLHVAGLGTFGLSDGLITPVGKAMRCGSIVTDARLKPTPRPYTTHTEYCPFHRDGSCGLCMARCPAGAITEHGHDKETCRNHIRSMHEEMGESGITIGGCGLCQAGVPCEAGIP